MKTPLELVKSKVQEACGDVMNLEVGGDIKVNLTNGGGEIATVVGIERDRVFWTWGKHHNNKTFVGSELRSRIIILGREIRLADVLRTVEKKSADYSIDTSGRFIRCSEEWIRDPESKLAIYWDLAHDSLSWHAENRPETVALLAEVLK